jgi:hypothetical protein
MDGSELLRKELPSFKSKELCVYADFASTNFYLAINRRISISKSRSYDKD